MKGKIVTVFGATGFLGKYVVAELVKAGYTIRAISRSSERSKALRTGAYVGQVVPIAANFNDDYNFDKLVENSYAVINLIGILYEGRKRKFSRLHTRSAEKLAIAAKNAGVEKFIHISAIVPESSKSKYAGTKLGGEKMVLATIPDAYIIKPSVIFGPEDNFFNKFSTMAKYLPLLPNIGGGKTKFQPVYVADVARAITKCVNGEAKPATYYIGGPQVMTFKEILAASAKHARSKCGYLPLPFSAAKLTASLLPSCILTRDQVELLKHDNIVPSKAKTLKDLGIAATPADAVLPSYI